MVTVTIDNQTIQVDDRLTILQVARKLGIDIPTICNDRRLKPFCACRICMVEVDPGNVLVASCHTKVMNNMVVRTKSDWVIRARKLNMELLLARHPLDCLVCDRGGECALQRVAFRVCQDAGEPLPGNRIVEIFGAAPMDIKLDDNRTIIERDLNKCILCRKCVRICNEVMGVDAICYSGRGADTQIGTFYGRALDCEFCGQCVDICPVGALFHKLSKYKARVWETEEAHTICGFCSSGCSMLIRTKQGELVRVLGDPKKGINDANLCVKGRYGYDFLNSKDRLRRPMIRREGNLQEVDWDTAFSYIAENLNRVMEKDGPEAIAGVGSIWATNEDNYTFQKFMRVVLGTNNIDTYARMEHAPYISLLAKTLGYPAASVSMDDFSRADLIVLVGCNITESHPIVGLAVKDAVREHGASLLVIDPQNIKMNRFGTQWLSNRIGSDAAVLNGVMRILWENKLIDRQFIKNNTEGFNEFEKSLERLDLAEIEKIGGVDRESLVKAAELIGESANVVFVYGMGLTQQARGMEAVRALLDLAVLTGNLGGEGAGIFPVRGHCNIQGACDMGVLPDYLPGYREVTDPESRKKFQEAWHSAVPEKPGMTLAEMIAAAEDNKIKAMVIAGEDLILALPGRERVEKALMNIEFLVVSDLFLSETARLADVVLPSRFLTEKDGCVTNTECRIQRVRKAVEPLGEAKSDWEIWSGLAKVMGYDMDYLRPSDIMQEISEEVFGYNGIRYEQIEETGRGFLMGGETRQETGQLYKKGFPVGKVKFQPVHGETFAVTTTSDYPYNLMAGKILFQFHTGSVSRKSQALSQLVAEPFVGINPEDAENIPVAETGQVRISTETGEVVAKVKFMHTLPQGVVFIPIHFDKLFNKLFALHEDRVNPKVKSCPAQLQAV